LAEDQNDLPEISLEAPPAQEPVHASGGTEFFGADSLALVSNKLYFAEALLRLTAKDCKFNDFTREILMTAMKVVKSEAGSLFELDAKTNQLFFRAAAGTSSDKVSSFSVPIGEGIVGFVAESRQPLVVGDAAENKIHLKKIDAAVGFKTRNLVANPILVRGQL
jgi:signal transduction protein with GAF and PtsI domain